MVKKTLAALAALMVLLAVGCSTVEGFGKDLSKLGDKIEDKAKR